MKQASRDMDAAEIARGDVSPQEMQRRNGFSLLMKGALILPQIRGRVFQPLAPAPAEDRDGGGTKEP
jgi:hypothetical protein